MNDMSASSMQVPDHIYVTGTKSDINVHRSRQFVPDMSEMRVPEKIIIGGSNQHLARKADPVEVLQDRVISPPLTDEPLPSIPTVLTANDYPLDTYKTAENKVPIPEGITSQVSIAIEDNPLGELKKMRRIMTSLTSRVKDLEDDQDRLQADLTYWKMFTTICGIILASAIIYVKRSR